ncbi:MAG: YecA family protein [Pseudomonadota bacterium]
MSSLSRRYRSARPDAGEFVPPNLTTFGGTPFGDPQRARLSTWLSESAWPREHMDITELEGYLVALIAWPVGISSGAWLPPIWGERGWKVPTKILSHQQYDEFVALVVGFMRTLDHELSRQPSRFESSVLPLLRGSEQVDALHRWGRGFMTALTLGAQGLKWRNESAGTAVRMIANITSASAPVDPQALEHVMSAVFALMQQRPSRGPLGPLVLAVPPDSPASAVETATVKSARSRG